MIADKGILGKPALPVGKRHISTLLIAAIVILVGIAAFGLGRLSALQEGKQGLVIHPAPTQPE
ncbi:MAG TPA: hypothetical protein VHD31_02445 [Candidatus Paceibacterota bacterium]|nr:hypothetical protein [Candidatus Paceibacterota bacterium]